MGLWRQIPLLSEWCSYASVEKTSGVRVTRSLVYMYVLLISLSFCTFSFGHCVVCLLAIVLSVFWPLCCLFFFDLQSILIAPLVSSLFLTFKMKNVFFLLLFKVEITVRMPRDRWSTLLNKSLLRCPWGSNCLLVVLTMQQNLLLEKEVVHTAQYHLSHHLMLHHMKRILGYLPLWEMALPLMNTGRYIFK